MEHPETTRSMRKLDLCPTGDPEQIVPRDASWLKEKGLLPYDKLRDVMISEPDYQGLLDMPWEEGHEGIDTLLSEGELADKVSPTGAALTAAMCEIYVRLGKLFPDKSDGWKKAETVLYFGKRILCAE